MIYHPRRNDANYFTFNVVFCYAKNDVVFALVCLQAHIISASEIIGKATSFARKDKHHSKIKSTSEEVLLILERMTGIEPARPAWKAGILPLNYIRIFDA